MAEIPVERKKSLTWLWVLLAILAIIAIIWWASDNDDDAAVVGPVEPMSEAVEPMPDTAAPIPEVTGSMPVAVGTAPGMSIGDILGNPSAYVGRDDFQADVSVPPGAPMTDRGFWVQDGGNRLFALIIDEPREVPKDINPGQKLRISQGMLRDASSIPNLPGKPIDADTRNVLKQQKVFLVVDEKNIQIVEAGTPQPGT